MCTFLSVKHLQTIIEEIKCTFCGVGMKILVTTYIINQQIRDVMELNPEFVLLHTI